MHPIVAITAGEEIHDVFIIIIIVHRMHKAGYDNMTVMYLKKRTYNAYKRKERKEERERKKGTIHIDT